MSTAGSGPGRRVRAYAYTLVTTAVVLVFALAEWGTERYVSDRSRAASTAIEIVIVLIAALVFRPVHQRIEAAVEAAFYRRKRQALAALDTFRRELNSFNDMEQLLRRVIEAVDHHLEASACAVYLRRDVFHAEASSFESPAKDVALDDPLAVRLRSSGAPAKPPLLQSSASGTHAFPMTLAGELVGFISVHARYGDYDSEELQMLAGLAQDLAAAVVALEPRLRARIRKRPNNISAHLTPLTGRERALREITAALSQSRLITITGPGGVGKTALALHCAAQQIELHEHGAWFVNLAPIVDGTIVAATILSALDAGTSEHGAELAHLVEHLRSRDALIVIDNCEQVIAETASIVSRIRAACPHITFLATSREPLHLEGEQVYRLGPLEPEEAVALFSQRAAAASPGFDAAEHAGVIRSICASLDGIPLAIELAAARARAISVEETLERLDERFRLLRSTTRTAEPRQQTLSATIEWSDDLLTHEEQSLVRRLAVFRGSFSLPAAAAVCAQDGKCDEFHVLDVLTSLVDKSLLVARVALSTRYHFLEMIREFAGLKAAQQHEMPDASEHHAAYFSALAAQAYHEFDSKLSRGWLDRLAPDVDNFRAALEWSLEGAGDRAAGAQLAADCGPVFLRLELLSEGLRWCDRARAVESLAPATAGRIEYVASMMHNNLGENRRALECAQRALFYYERSQDERGSVRALSQVAQLYARSQRFEDAKAPAIESIRRARELGEPRVLIAVLRRCGSSLPQSQIEEARRYLSEALEIARAVRDPEEESMVLSWWAAREAACGSLERAIEIATDALQHADRDSQLYLEGQIAGWAVALGQFDEAAPHMRKALALALERQHPLRALLIAYASGLHSERNPREAALLLGYARARLRELEWEPEADDERAMQNIERAIESSLDGDEFAALLKSGAALPEPDALSLLAPTSALDGEGHGSAVAGHGIGALLI